ncbi:hypothetical protein PP590_gp47 [Pseudoalteromonas phage HS1]|uniref:hypothetical protein n=1 Tax=Pseudoalteromonas phage HS1 TaxID=1357707 RepID=UPI002329821A|nr:hypothetical protein PP590_gp47 [Pseudoalteromonas phage HS1]
MRATNEESRERRKKAYYQLAHDIQMMRYKMNEIKRHRGHSPAFKNLMLAFDIFEDQVSQDFSNYEKNIKKNEITADNRQLQNSLNRERKLRHELELKIKEASESSGLFISYVRKKLKI